MFDLRRTFRPRRALRAGLFAAALALACMPAAFAYPQAPPGSATVVVYYSGSDHAYIVGRKVVNSQCPPEAQPLTFVGRTSSYSSVNIYPCNQVPGPDSPPPVD